MNLKKYVLFPSLCLSFVAGSFQPVSAQLHPVPKESSLHFTIRNFGFKSGGVFDPPEGDIHFNPDNLAGSSFRVSIKSETVNTDNNSRDEHLREADYFDVKNYPDIRFVSTAMRAIKNNQYEVTGNLTVKKTTREIKIPFTANKNGNGWLFTGSFNMNRRDYGVGGSSTLSNELEVDLKVLAQ